MPTGYRWFKTYVEILDDPKMARLPDRLWRRTMEMFAFARKHGDNGDLPPVEDMAWVLHMDETELTADLEALANLSRPLVRETCDGWQVVNFAKRQAPESDAERKEAQRERDRRRPEPVTPPADDVTEMSRDVTGTCPDKTRQDKTETQTETQTTADPDETAPVRAPAAADSDLPAVDDVDDARALLERIGVGEPNLTRCSGYPVALVGAWIAEGRRRLDNGQVRNLAGWVVGMLASGTSPPKPKRDDGDWRRFLEGPYAAYIEH